MLNQIQKNIIKAIFIISLVALITAYFVEYILGYQPCNLCLMERLPYAAALLIILISYKLKHLEKQFILLLIIIFFAASILSLYHFGIEQGFIEESLVCDLQNSLKILSKEEILQQLQEKKVNCKDVTFKIFGLSLTTFNIIISILLTTTLTKIYLNYEKNK